MSNLFVTENLEVITKTVTVHERFDNGDMIVLENGPTSRQHSDEDKESSWILELYYQNSAKCCVGGRK